MSVTPLHRTTHPKAPMPRVGTVNRQPQRARLTLLIPEETGPVRVVEDGWAAVDGPWVLFLADEADSWQSWGSWCVVCIDWIGEAS